MEKQTKLLLGLGLIGVGGYMLWKQGQNKPASASLTGFGGRRMRGANGKRKKKNMAMMAGGTVEAHQSTFNATGNAFSHGGFFNVADSGWQGFTGGPEFFRPQDSGWQGFAGDNMMVKDSGWQG